ncbi:DUF5011 domain-containing protein [Allocoprobacillus halotolerans]|uniref:DUF5011 domain-containing protein n=1 Tax=Allocoprobacillus halotolerans TaxID=2944914 RepID=A0ABY5I3C9_9FIRM|nr:C40 family peptidase [Allocoprobacillus halotolerans]UTY38894.1 DUF5011 domain-containing protein [Allocoprobacillus halotolerans]
MDSNIKTNLLEIMQEHVLKRKAMFIPMLCISTFGLVGYAAVDKEKPTIEANKIEVLYGTKLDKTMFAISDNRDSLDAMDVKIDDTSYDAYQLGIYNVEVTATDMFSNLNTKVVQVEVVDKTAPELKPVGEGQGYVIDVEANGSQNITQYVSASDNVDGDVTAFIESNKKLDTSKLGSQMIALSVSDNAGNTTEQTYEFYVSDTTAPTISYKKGSTVTVDYGSQFDYSDYIKVTDNFDKTVKSIDVDGTVNTKKDGETTLKITAKDSSGNTSEKSLTVKVGDLSAPKISLSKSSVQITKGKSFDAKNYLESATDNKDGNLASQVKISSSVNTKKAGKYTVTYSVSDKAGNSTSKSLKVTVVNPDDIAPNQGMVATAKSRLGCPYKWGATGPSSFDCSGFTQWVYRKNGKSIPRTSGAQKSGGTRISLSSVKPGDIVWRPGHVGIYVGGGRVIHAPHSGAVVSYTSLSGFTCGVRY